MTLFFTIKIKDRSLRQLLQGRGLQDGEVVTHNQPGLIHIPRKFLIVGAVSRIAQTQADILERARLDHVLQLAVAFPLFAFLIAARDFDVVTVDITGQETQAVDADGLEVIVVTQLQERSCAAAKSLTCT